MKQLKKLGVLMILSAWMITFTACENNEQRRGTPHQGSEQKNGGDGQIRPGVDGSEAVGQSPNDTVSTGNEGQTSY